MPKTSRRFAAAETVAPAGYTPPANPEAEQSVLGAILVRPEVMDRIADLIVPEDFYREAHGRIYQAMLDLYGRGEPVDLVTVSALLKERGKLEGVGGPVFLAGLSEQVGFATNAEYYANLVHDKSVLRRLLDCTQEIAASCLALTWASLRSVSPNLSHGGWTSSHNASARILSWGGSDLPASHFLTAWAVMGSP